jgi:hypothetical protein
MFIYAKFINKDILEFRVDSNTKGGFLLFGDAKQIKSIANNESYYDRVCQIIYTSNKKKYELLKFAWKGRNSKIWKN